MGNLNIWLEGMLVGVALAAPIGPINIEIVRRTLVGGFLHGWLVGIGAVTADTVYCALVVGGFVGIADSPMFRAPLLIAGAVVLLYLGVTGIRASLGGAKIDGEDPSNRASYVTGLVMAAANPIGIIYWLSIGAALIASAVAKGGESAAPMVIGGVFSGIVVWVTFLSGASQFGRAFVSPRALGLLSAFGAVLLLVFGVIFGVEGVRELVRR